MPVTTASGTDMHALDRAHDTLHLSWADVGAIVGVDESTIHRWRSGTSVPRPTARSRLAQLQGTLDLLRRVFAGPDLTRQWLTEKRSRRAAWDAALSDLLGDDWSSCWTLTRAVRAVADALQALSARGTGRNMPLFPDRESSDLEMNLASATRVSTPARFVQRSCESW